MRREALRGGGGDVNVGADEAAEVRLDVGLQLVEEGGDDGGAEDLEGEAVGEVLGDGAGGEKARGGEVLALVVDVTVGGERGGCGGGDRQTLTSWA
jgi:hypothetical protein